MRAAQFRLYVDTDNAAFAEAPAPSCSPSCAAWLCARVQSQYFGHC